MTAPPRRLTQVTASTAHAQRDRHTRRTIVLHQSAPSLSLPQYPWQHTIHEINVGVYRTSCGSRRQYKIDSIRMSSFQQKTCSKCGLHPAAGNQLRRCGSCLAVKYCSSACQTEDWASHRLVCKSVGAARKEELLPLLLAARNGDVATVERLLKA